MSDNYVQNSGGGTFTTSGTQTLNGVVAGNTIIVYLMDGSDAAGPTSPSVSDGTAYTAKKTALDAANSVWLGTYIRENVSAGNYTITGTINTSSGGFMIAVEVGVTSGPGYADDQATEQNGPGTGTDAITTPSLSIPAASTLVSLAVDSSVAVTGAEPNIGTSFTNRTSGFNGSIGSWRLQTRAASANVPATATINTTNGTGADHTIISGVAIKNTGGGGSNVVEEDAEWPMFVQAA